MLTPRASRTAVVVGAVVIAGFVLACMSKIATSTVKTQAARDLDCDETKVHVEVADASAPTTSKAPTYYRVEGCGTKALYVCEGWDSYSQKPICEREK